MIKRAMMTAAAASLLALGVAGPAAADHDHQLHNPSGCHTVPVSHQDHGADDPGRKFHGGAHKGPSVDEDGRLGNGHSQVTVAGGACE